MVDLATAPRSCDTSRVSTCSNARRTSAQTRVELSTHLPTEPCAPPGGTRNGRARAGQRVARPRAAHYLVYGARRCRKRWPVRGRQPDGPALAENAMYMVAGTALPRTACA